MLWDALGRFGYHEQINHELIDSLSPALPAMELIVNLHLEDMDSQLLDPTFPGQLC